MEAPSDTPPRADDARDTCANCDAALSGPWCQACGQRDLGTRLELKELLGEVVRETFEVEGALPRTLASIAVRPGHYLGQVLAGKRRSYASPFRFYLFMLFVFAVAMNSCGERVAREVGSLIVQGSAGRAKGEVSGFNVTYETVGTDDYGTMPPPLRERLLAELAGGRAGLASLVWHPELACHQPTAGPAGSGRGLLTVDARLVSTLTAERVPGDVFVIGVKAVLQQVPIVFSLVVVGHVLLLQLLWWREPLSAHVVTSLVLHDLLLLALALWALWPRPLLLLLLLVWVQLHVLFGLKAAYGSSWRRTLLAYVLASAGWSVLAMGGLGLALRLALNDLTQVYVP